MLAFGRNQEPGTVQRIRRPPGGESNICLGDWRGDEERVAPRIARNSSNAFASGARQNCQNVLTDVPSTRVKAPPGGRSSISLGWDMDAQPSRGMHAVDGRSGGQEEFLGRHPRARPGMLDNDSEDEDAQPEAAARNEGRSPVECYPPRTPPGRPGRMVNDGGRTPPGGASSVCLAWSDAPERNFAPRTPPSSNREVPGAGTRTPPRSSANGMDCYDAGEPHRGFAPRTPPGGTQSVVPTHASGNAPRRGLSSQASFAWDDAPEHDAFASRRALGAEGAVDPYGRTPSSDPAAYNDAHERHRGNTPRTATSCSSQPGYGRTPQERPSSAWGEDASRSGFAAKTPPAPCPRSCESSDGGVRGARARPHTASSVSLAWDEAPERKNGTTPRSNAGRREDWVNNRDTRHDNESEGSWAAFGRQMDGRAGKASYDPSALTTLKSRMGQKKSSSGVSTTAGSQIYDEHCGFGNFSVPVQEQMYQRTASAPRLHAKEEIEGSRPRKWKPAKNPRAPPGEFPPHSASRDCERDDKFGRKRFADIGTGHNRDANAVEALRFYQEEERLGRNPVERRESVANRPDRDSHRYYLAAEGKPELTPGKMRYSASSRAGGFNDRMTSQSTSAAGSGEDMHSEADSLPLGAEWSSCRFEGGRLQPL